MVTDFLKKLKEEYASELKKAENDYQINLRRVKENEEHISQLSVSAHKEDILFLPKAVKAKDFGIIEELQKQNKYLLLKNENRKQDIALIEKKILDLEEVFMLEQSDSLMGIANYNLVEEKRKVLEVQEVERQRIARDLHDTTIQNLTSLLHKCELCRKLADVDINRCKLEISTMEDNLRCNISDLRNVIFDLRPMSFDIAGLLAAVEHLLDEVEKTGNVKVSFIVEGKPKLFDSIVELSIYRVISEACVNILKHAKAKKIDIKLLYSQEYFEVIIKDDGVGFDVHELLERANNYGTGFGISFMKERVLLLSGIFSLDSKNNQGTTIYIKIPDN